MVLAYSSALLLTALLAFSLALFFKDEDSVAITRSWRAVLFADAIWALGRSILPFSNTSATALFWIRFSYFGSIWLPVSFLWLVHEFTGRKKDFWLFCGLALIFIVFSFSNFKGSFISEAVPKLGFPFYDDSPKISFHLWSAFFWILLIYSYVILIQVIRRSDRLTRRRLWFVLLSGVLGFGGSITTFPLVINIPIFPYGVFIIPFYPLLLTYAVIRYQVMEIQLLLRDSTVHIIASSIFGGVFIFVSSTLNQKWLYLLSQGILIFFLPLLYPSVSRWVRKKINRTRWGEIDRYLDDIEERTITLIGSSLTISSLSTATLGLMTSIFPIREAAVYFWRSKSQSLHLYAKMGLENVAMDIEKSLDVYKALASKKEVFWKEVSLGSEIPQNKSLLNFLAAAGCEVLAPIHDASSQLCGLLVFGEKISLARFHRRDLEAIKFVAKKIGIACNYATTTEKYTVVMQDWTHSLNQITKPIVHNAGMIKEFIHMMSPEEILDAADVIERRGLQLREVHEYITNASAMSREVVTGEYRTELMDVSTLIREYANNYKVKEDHQIVVFDIKEKDVFSYVNKTAIERVLLELISNSLRHTNSKKSEAQVIVKDSLNAEGYEVRVEDNGDGIDPNNIDKIWEPGWQQKDMNSGASGLGLAICKQVIEVHGGKIKAFSAGKGRGMDIHFTIPIVKQSQI